MHPLLQRQLKRLGVESGEAAPTPQQWRDLLAKVSRTYGEADQDRYTMERSLGVSSREMQDLYENLRRSSEHRLAKLVAVLEATQEVAIDGILVVDADRDNIKFNRRFAEIWQLPPHLAGARQDDKLLAGVLSLVKRPDQFLARVQHLYAHPLESSRDEIQLVDGRVLDRYSAPVRSADGDHHGRVWFFRDVTAERDAHRRLEEWAAELEQRVAERTAELEQAQGRLVASERLAAVGQLAAGTAHEINNPLAYVLSNITFASSVLQRLAEGRTEGPIAEALEALADANEGAERIRHTTRDLKTFSRGDKDVRTAVDVSGALASSINMAANEIRHRARLVRDLQPIAPVDANEGRLGQVFLNLLLNAAQSIPEGDFERNEIRVRTREIGEHVAIEIIDTGTGIAPENMRRLFEPFFTTKPVGIGTGLGLSICHGIVKGLGGGIEVESEVGKGTTMRVLLPKSTREVAPAAAPERALNARRRGRILVVDDEPQILEVVQRALRSHYDVVADQDARSALGRVWRGEKFDAIVCDLMMPNLTGMDFHAAVSPALAKRFVFLTGGAFTDRTRAFLDLVDNPRVEKPFAVNDLVAAIDSRFT